MRAVAIVMLVGACSHASAPPATHGDDPKPRACAADSDCTLVTALPPKCCSECSAIPLNVAAAKQATETCEATRDQRPGYFVSCPNLDCPCEHQTAACEQGNCVATSTPCTP